MRFMLPRRLFHLELGRYGSISLFRASQFDYVFLQVAAGAKSGL